MFKFLLSIIISLFSFSITYADTGNEIYREKNTQFNIPIVLESINEEIERVDITITFDESAIELLWLDLSEGILNNYSHRLIDALQDKAIISIYGSGISAEKGQVANLTFFALGDSTSTILSIENLKCNNNDVEGGLLINDEMVKFIRINVLDSDEAIVFSEFSNIFIYEDGQTDPIFFTVTDLLNETNNFSISVDSSNQTLVPVLPSNIILNTSSSNRSIVIIPNENEFGTSDITITANGINGSNEASFTLTVQEVNDPPDFTKGGDIEVEENSGQSIYKGWATNIGPGPENESNQTLKFILSIDKEDLFQETPEIDSETGDLIFTVADNISGSTNIELILQDNGGTANDGQNTCQKSFKITVSPYNPTLSSEPVATLKFLSTHNHIKTGESGAFIRLICVDDKGNPTSVESDTSIWLSSTSDQTGWFYTDENGWDSGNVKVELKAGDHSTLFKYMDFKSGTWSIMANEDPDAGWEIIPLQITVSKKISGDINFDDHINQTDVLMLLNKLSEKM